MSYSETYSNVLLLEPYLSEQMMVLEAVRMSHTPVELACVSTCGGARQALSSHTYDALLISANLCYFSEEGMELGRLVQSANDRGMATLLLQPAGSRLSGTAMGMPVHESVSHDELTLGALTQSLERARARADFDRALQRFADHDRMALVGRAVARTVRDLSATLTSLRADLVGLDLAARSAPRVDATLGAKLDRAARNARLMSDWVSDADTPHSPSAFATSSVDQALDRAVALVHGGDAASVTVARSYRATREVAADAVLLCQVFANLLLTLGVGAGEPGPKLELSTWADEVQVVVELRTTSSPLSSDMPSGFDETRDGLGFWVSRRLLSRWGAELVVEDAVESGTTLRVTFPIPAWLSSTVAA